jgi:ubiquitin-conjugating enzyme E2 J2
MSRAGTSKERKAVNSTALARLRQDYMRLKKDPIPYITAEPLQSNILEWHYIVRGPESSPYTGGMYHGKLKFPPEFPFKPPSIYMITPNGRFKTNTRLCLSISDFHPDTWNPAWSVGTILTGLLSFMLEKSPTLGSLESSDLEKKTLALKSLDYNLKDKTVQELFPEIVEEMKKTLAARQAAAAAATTSVLNPLNGLTTGTLNTDGPGSSLQSAVATLIVAIGFAAFVYSVKYVLRSIAYDE